MANRRIIMRIFVICSVRDGTPKEVADHVEKLEAAGHIVHFPPRDCNQTDDGVGLTICRTHRAAMAQADEVHVHWNPESKGSHFDFGMAFALHKPIHLINMPEKTLHKSYGNVLGAINEQ